MKELKWDLSDITIVPAEESNISSRSECNVLKNYIGLFNSLPLMVSPMDTVVSDKNYLFYINNGIIPCIPRGQGENILSLKIKNCCFRSFGLCDIEKGLEFDDFIKNENDVIDVECKDPFYLYPNVLIDMANAHMSKLIEVIKRIKSRWPDISLMVGNVANPETFINLGLAGADYIRLGVGTGGACLTSANIGVNYPMGSLISECYELRKHYGLNTKIVADGGMRNYSDIIKAISIGADLVMIGYLFNRAIESAGFNYLYGVKINNKLANLLWIWNFPIKKKYRGMSTKSVQRNWGKSNLVTAEGITKYQKVEYTLSQWTENFKDYLRSAMSYCNAKELDDFIGKAQYVFITQNSLDRFNK